MKIRQILMALTALAALLGATTEVQAAARVASVTGDWGNTATWGGAAVPVAGDTITINTGINVTGLGGANRACASIVIQGTGTLTVDANILTLTSTVAVGSAGGTGATLTIASGATMTGITTLSFVGTTPTVANNGTLSLTVSRAR
jgi:hypothetical protein